MTQTTPRSDERVLSVSELNRLAREALETRLPLAWVAGEISNFMQAASGHWYFTLKDAQAQVRAVMFRGRSTLLDFRPANGDRVEIRAQAGLYEPRGEFQLQVDWMRPAGLGQLFVMFTRLKEALAAEGLFDASRKRPLPVWPRRIGVISSLRAAALHDVLVTLSRRMPSIPLVIYPSPVQGLGAAAQLASAMDLACRRAECDVLLLCRGGGSIEDLWAFNEEILARAIVRSSLPVVTGIGHETDFTIADFVADQRANTPTAAAELASPSAVALRARLTRLGQALQHAMARSLLQRVQSLDRLSTRLRPPSAHLRQRRAQLDMLAMRLYRARQRQQQQHDHRFTQLQYGLLRYAPPVRLAGQRLRVLQDRLQRAARETLTGRVTRIDNLARLLAQLAPETVLSRGYSIVRTPSGTIIRDSQALRPGQALQITLAKGEIDVRVEKRRDPAPVTQPQPPKSGTLF
jgi:exodeoxyribonuclease VII large subunit